ncbi:MAG: CDP-glycerol glycerophosphotransferase family protein [Candidatus Reddybacter sp.]
MEISSVRDKIVNFIRTIDDWFYEDAKQTRVLFVYVNSHGFSCQIPVIEALRKVDNIQLHVTTDKPYKVDKSNFSNANEYETFKKAYTPYSKAIYKKWHLIVDSHVNGFYPKRNALRIGMHHGPGFGIMGRKIQLVKNYDVFFGLSQTERKHFENLEPGIFDRERAFFPIGFPKSDALINNVHSPEATRARLNLDNRPVLLITSHWAPISTLATFKQCLFEVLCQTFPECNIVQTGHPWLWSGHQQGEEVTQNLFEQLMTVDQKYKNAYFLPYENAEQLLKISDLLVADHSSIITTYSLLYRPIVWFENPDLNFSIDEIGNIYRSASHVFSKLEELPNLCRQALTHPNEKAAGRQLMRETFYANPGRAGQRAAEILAKIGSTCSTKSPRWQSVINESRKPSSDSQPIRSSVDQ